MIDVYIYPVTGKPYKKQISKNLTEYQKIVGGYIEICSHPITEKFSFDSDENNDSKVHLIINEEGHWLNLDRNENIKGIRGQCFIIRDIDFD